MRLCRLRSRREVVLGLSSSGPPHVLLQALYLQRSVEELQCWLEPIEIKLRVPIMDQDQPGLDELLEAQGELEAAVDRQARQAQALLGQVQAFIQEDCCIAQDVEDQAQRLLHR